MADPKPQPQEYEEGEEAVQVVLKKFPALPFLLSGTVPCFTGSWSGFPFLFLSPAACSFRRPFPFSRRSAAQHGEVSGCAWPLTALYRRRLAPCRPPAWTCSPPRQRLSSSVGTAPMQLVAPSPTTSRVASPIPTIWTSSPVGMGHSSLPTTWRVGTWAPYHVSSVPT